MQLGDSFFSRLLKMDAHNGSAEVWEEEDTYPGEPIFVPQPGAAAEDQGIVLSVVLAGGLALLIKAP